MNIEQRIKINASRAQVFCVYEDVEKWPSWDRDVIASSIVGKFEAGTTGKLKPVRGPVLNFELIEVSKNISFTSSDKLPLCTIRFVHELTSMGQETQVVHRVLFSGVLAPLFRRLIGSDIAKGLPSTLTGLKEYGELAGEFDERK